MTSDLELLRRFEPVIRYTRGEFFFPMAVEPYLRDCDLWAEAPDGERRLLVRQGELTIDELGAWQSRAPESRLFLRYVQHPLSGIELTRPGRPRAAGPRGVVLAVLEVAAGLVGFPRRRGGRGRRPPAQRHAGSDKHDDQGTS